MCKQNFVSRRVQLAASTQIYTYTPLHTHARTHANTHTHSHKLARTHAHPPSNTHRGYMTDQTTNQSAVCKSLWFKSPRQGKHVKLANICHQLSGQRGSSTTGFPWQTAVINKLSSPALVPLAFLGKAIEVCSGPVTKEDKKKNETHPQNLL